MCVFNIKIKKNTEHSQLKFLFCFPLYLPTSETDMRTIFDYRSNGLSKASVELDVRRQGVWSINCRCRLIPLNLQERQGRVVHHSAYFNPLTEVTH